LAQVRCELDKAVLHLSANERMLVQEMLRKHESVWSRELGHINVDPFEIHTTPGPPVHSQPYRAGAMERRVIREEVDRMLALGVVEPSTSAWSSPVVLVPKPDGTNRFCVEFRKLNARTTRDVYPLPRLDDASESLGDAKNFTILDARSGFWQIDMSEEAQIKAAFTCHA
jgi:hypothetical protein